MYEAIVKFVIKDPDQSVLSKESTQSVPNFTSFKKLIKEFRFQKESVSFLSILAPTIAQVPKYIGKTTFTFYAISQHKMYLLILYNQNNIFMAAILKKTCHHP